MESKGVKSNAEKWHKLYNYDHLVKFLYDHSDKIHWIDRSREIEPQIITWINDHLPKFQNENQRYMILRRLGSILKMHLKKKQKRLKS